MQFEHIGIYITDLEKSKEFYTQVLGCKIVDENNRPGTTLVFLDAFGATLELIYKENILERPIGPIDHISFRVDDLEQKLIELEKHGIKLDSDPRDTGFAKIAFFRGPDGERFEFMEKYNK